MFQRTLIVQASIVRGAALSSLAALAACQFDAKVQPCTLSCTASAACPDGYVCKAGFCAKPQQGPLCSDVDSGLGDAAGAPGVGGEPTLPAPNSIALLSVGSDHNCALFDNGGIRCWGSNGPSPCGALGFADDLHVGDDELPDSASYLKIAGRVTALELGNCFSCALLTGRARCWGKNDHGQLGYGHTRPIDHDQAAKAAEGVAFDARIVALAAGTAHVCALMQTGDVACWGLGQFGQLGYGTVDDIGDDEAPTAAGMVALGRPARQLAAGVNHTCALLDDGSVRCWGENAFGSLGLGHGLTVGDDETPDAYPPVELGGAAAQICAGGNRSCALLDDGSVRCWGRGANGRLGLGVDFGTRNLGDDESPTAVPAIDLGGPALEIACGGDHACALMEDRSLRCFGRNEEGQLGYGNRVTVGDNETPATVGAVPLGGEVQAVSLGRQHSCALVSAADTPQVMCWGLNQLGQLGYRHKRNVGDSETPEEEGFVALF